eukprot:gene7771-12241_t
MEFGKDYDCTIDEEVGKSFKKLVRQESLSCLILKIDMKSRTVVVDDFLENTNWDDIQEEMSETAPRFLLVISPIVHKDDRKSYPLVQIYYSPEGCATELNMLYSRMKPIVEKKFNLQYTFTERDSEELSEDWLLTKLNLKHIKK